jgi:mycothiol synthase
MGVTELRPDELLHALELAFQCLPEAERERRKKNLTALLAGGTCTGVGVFALHDARGEIAGIVLCELLPGRTGLLWPPQVTGLPSPEPHEDLLARLGVDWLTNQGATVIQAVLGADETRLAAPLLRVGFVHATSLRYLRRPLNRSVDARALSPQLTMDRESACDVTAFQQSLLRSYDGTLDCPELNGRRALDDIIAGHKAHGRYDPEFWWLMRYGGRPVGVLIAAGVPDRREYEVAYVGVIPEMRGRGIARETMIRALAEMRSREASAVAISVDCRNEPALRLYAGLGFSEFDRREVYFRL